MTEKDKSSLGLLIPIIVFIICAFLKLFKII